MIKGVRETSQWDTYEQKVRSLGMLLAASLLGNLWAEKPKIPAWGVIKSVDGVIQTGKGVIRVDEYF